MKLRERPLNLKGFFLKNILIPNVAEKNILILVEGLLSLDREASSTELCRVRYHGIQLCGV
jgi:hypothetical protein